MRDSAPSIKVKSSSNETCNAKYPPYLFPMATEKNYHRLGSIKPSLYIYILSEYRLLSEVYIYIYILSVLEARSPKSA